MKRREFTNYLALGLGTCGLTQAGTAAADQAPPAAQVPETSSVSPTMPVDPVNVADFQRLAQTALPAATYDYITTGTTDEVTLRENIAAFQRLKLLPPLLTGVGQVETSTTILGQRIALPILLAPVAAQNLYHADGVLASARAAAQAQTILGVSSSAGHSVEEVAAASTGPKWLQVYMPKDRTVGRQLVERATRAGFQAIVLTVDLGELKDADRRNRFTVPEPELRKHMRNIGFPGTENMTYAELNAFNSQAWDLSLSWDIFDWLRSITKLPLLIKGVLRAEDALKACDKGVNGIVVSNHGGRRLDGVPASIEQLPEIVAAVKGRAEILLDSGVRRGTDVLKALALGARAVLIGRPYAWALAAQGEAGVARILQLLKEELVSAMLATGCPDVQSIRPSLIKA